MSYLFLFLLLPKGQNFGVRTIFSVTSRRPSARLVVVVGPSALPIPPFMLLGHTQQDARRKTQEASHHDAGPRTRRAVGLRLSKFPSLYLPIPMSAVYICR